LARSASGSVGIPVPAFSASLITLIARSLAAKSHSSPARLLRCPCLSRALTKQALSTRNGQSSPSVCANLDTSASSSRAEPTTPKRYTKFSFAWWDSLPASHRNLAPELPQLPPDASLTWSGEWTCRWLQAKLVLSDQLAWTKSRSGSCL